MIAYPDSTIRVAMGETVSLEPDADFSIETVLLTYHDGTEIENPLDSSLQFTAKKSPDFVTVQWFGSGSSTAVFTSHVEVVPRHYFTIEQLAEYDNGQDHFDALDDDVLWMARQAATEVFEQNAGRSFVARLGKTKDYGREPVFYVDHDIQELLTDGYRMVSDSLCERMPGTQVPCWVEYVYGARYLPADVQAAVLTLAAYMLRPSNVPLGATGQSTDAGYIRFTIAGRDGATSIPEVNAAIQQFGAGDRWVW